MRALLPAPAVDVLGNIADLRPISAIEIADPVLLSADSDTPWLLATPDESKGVPFSTPTHPPQGMPTPPTRLLPANVIEPDADATDPEHPDLPPSEHDWSSLRFGSPTLVPPNARPPPDTTPPELRITFQPGPAVKNMLDRMNFTGQLGIRPGISGLPAEPIPVKGVHAKAPIPAQTREQEAHASAHGLYPRQD